MFILQLENSSHKHAHIHKDIENAIYNEWRREWGRGNELMRDRENGGILEYDRELVSMAYRA